MLSVLIPVHGALPYLKRCLASLEKNTSNIYEPILIDDCSDEETKEFLASYVLAFKGRIQLVTNKEQKWINYNWNNGVQLASYPYIAIFNSDIEVSPFWDKYCIENLSHSMITCPYELEGNTAFTIKKFFPPYMIKGCCFVFKEKDKNKLFPIPFNLRHLCGDNVIADQCMLHGGKVFFDKRFVITHGVEQSSKDMDKKEYYRMFLNDIQEYMKLPSSKKSLHWMQPILKVIEGNVNKLWSSHKLANLN